MKKHLYTLSLPHYRPILSLISTLPCEVMYSNPADATIRRDLIRPVIYHTTMARQKWLWEMFLPISSPTAAVLRRSVMWITPCRGFSRGRSFDNWFIRAPRCSQVQLPLPACVSSPNMRFDLSAVYLHRQFNYRIGVFWCTRGLCK